MKQSQNRIKKELQEVRKDANSGVTVEVDESAATLTHFFGVINGPDDTPYAVGLTLHIAIVSYIVYCLLLIVYCILFSVYVYYY